MKLSEVKSALHQLNEVHFKLPDGTNIPQHFHVTEVGKITKHFIDCGGVERKEEVINFQLWTANDYHHRLHPDKMRSILQLAENTLCLNDLEIEVEYQSETIGKYGLMFDGKNFVLVSSLTACLAPDQCGIPVEKPKVKLADLNASGCCPPGGNCC